MKKIFAASIVALSLSGCNNHIDESRMYCTFDSSENVMSVFNTITNDLVITVDGMMPDLFGNYKSGSDSEFSLPENSKINGTTVYLDDRQECELRYNTIDYTTSYTLRDPELAR